MEILARRSSLGACLLTELFIDESYAVYFGLATYALKRPVDSGWSRDDTAATNDDATRYPSEAN